MEVSPVILRKSGDLAADVDGSPTSSVARPTMCKQATQTVTIVVDIPRLPSAGSSDRGADLDRDQLSSWFTLAWLVTACLYEHTGSASAHMVTATGARIFGVTLDYDRVAPRVPADVITDFRAVLSATSGDPLDRTRMNDVDGDVLVFADIDLPAHTFVHIQSSAGSLECTCPVEMEPRARAALHVLDELCRGATRVADVALASHADQSAAVQAVADHLRRTLPAELPRPVHWRVLDVAAAHPGREAICDTMGHRLTYAQLVLAAEHVRAALAAHPAVRAAPPNAPVACFFDASALYVPATLGIALLGRPFLPLAVRLPPARVAWLLQRAGACAIVSDGSLAAVHGDAAWPAALPLLLVDPALTEFETSTAEAQALRARQLAAAHTPADALPTVLQQQAYIRFTSGSTGEPKAVCIGQHSLALFAHSMDSVDGLFSERETVLAVAQWTFDASQFELHVLTRGGRVVLSAESQRRAPDTLLSLAQHEQVTFLPLTPTLARLLLAQRAPLPYKMALFGEALPLPLARELRNAGASSLFNLYGPTEATVCSTGRSWLAGEPLGDGDGTASMGAATPCAGVLLLDLQGRPQCVAGAAGELLVCGPLVGEGYVPEPADSPFVRHRLAPFIGTDAGGDTERLLERTYATGDVVRRRVADGELVFVGRRDSQVKLGGIRVDLSEIEAALVRHCPFVQSAAVSVRRYEHAQRLVAYVVKSASVPVPIAGLSRAVRQALRPLLPPEQCPHVVVSLPALPLTAHGKLDRRCVDLLPVPTMATTSDESPALGPASLPAVTPRVQALLPLLRALFAQALGLATVGDGDDVFDLGGTSLTLPRLSARLSALLGATVPPSLFLRASSPAAAAVAVDAMLPAHISVPSAECIRGGVIVAPTAPLLLPSEARASELVRHRVTFTSVLTGGLGTDMQRVRFVPLGDADALAAGSPAGAPLFLVHPAFTSAVIMAAMAWFIGRGMAVIGIEPTRPLTAEDRIEELAEAYAEAVMAQPLVQAGRRFVVGGWSLGGNIAHAMEHALRTRWHRPPAGLLLIDTHGPDSPFPETSLPLVAGVFQDVSRWMLGRAICADPQVVAGLRDLEELIAYAGRCGIDAGIITEAGMPAVRAVLLCTHVSMTLESRYHRRLVDELAAAAAGDAAAATAADREAVPVVLFTASERFGVPQVDACLAADGMLGWRPYMAGRVCTVQPIPATHSSIIRTSELAQAIRQFLVSVM